PRREPHESDGKSNPALFTSGTLVGPHKLIRELGRGGMGAVYLAHDTRLNRRVAIKFLLDSNPSYARRFMAEARATARCKHDNIVDIYEVGEAQGHAYMVLEYIRGMTLRTWINRYWEAGGPGDASPLEGKKSSGPARPRKSQSLAAERMIPVVDALVHAHEQGLVHRDLKPSNIMLTEDDAIRVLDFGIAKVLTPQILSDTSSGVPQDSREAVETVPGAVIGTIPYMSPEQWAGQDLDGRSDLWAVGIMLWEIATGNHPLAPLTTRQLLDVAEVDVAMPLMTERYPALCPLANLVDRCLRKRRDERIPSARVLLDELRQLASPQVIPGAATSAAEPHTDAQFDKDESPSNRSLPAMDALDESDSASPATKSLATGRAPAYRRPLAAVASIMVVGVIVALLVAWLATSQDVSSRDSAATPTALSRPANQPAWTSADGRPTSEAILAVVAIDAATSDESAAPALCRALREHPHKSALLPATQDTRGLVWCRAAMNLALAKQATRNVATPVVVAVHDDGAAQIAVRGPRGSWLIDGLTVFTGSDAAHAQLAPVLYGLAQVQRGRATRAGCVGRLPDSSTVDPLAVLRLYVNRQQPVCRQQAERFKPTKLLAICEENGRDPGHSGVCDLARLLYIELDPEADDAVSVLRALLDRRPELIAVAGAALARTSCRLDRLATANAVLSDLFARLGTGVDHACERLALADVAVCIAENPKVTEELGDPNSWRASIDRLENMMASDCAACGSPAYCAEKLAARALIRGRRGHWNRAAADFAEAYAYTHDSQWALLRAEASLHLTKFDDARRRLQDLAERRALKAPVEHLQHALFSWLAASGPHRARGSASSLMAVHAQRLVDVYEHCCTQGECSIDPDDAPLRALVCGESPDSCLYDILAGPRTRSSVPTLRRLLNIADPGVVALSKQERAALRRTCAAADR
ncbi:MAG: serine/threonine protein kinase, partial [Proteobacteria bacterium]|nr:serine/threonine protein kinase [Pseudomonadota bacterium]